jgi:hypothetical protein
MRIAESSGAQNLRGAQRLLAIVVVPSNPQSAFRNDRRGVGDVKPDTHLVSHAESLEQAGKE